MFFSEPDHNLIAKFNMAEAKGASIDELKEIQLEIAASYGARLDNLIYRVININHLIADYEAKEITLPHINVHTYGLKSGENPLKDKKFKLSDGTICNIDTNDYFGSCWSTDNNSQRSFKNFDQSNDAIIIQSTVRKVLVELMNTENVFYALNYHVRPILYAPRADLNQFIEQTPIEDYMEPSGGRLAQTLFMLPDDFSDENEVRFVYWHQITNNEWSSKNIIRCKNSEEKLLCKHPFDWDRVIDDVIFDPDSSDYVIEKQHDELKKAGVLK